VRIELDDAYDLGREFYRWEIATAVAGAVLSIHPFDQPDVEASKVETRRLTDAFEREGALPAEKPCFEGEGLRLFADARNARALGRRKDLAGFLKAHFGRLKAGDYAALLAYLPMNAENERSLSRIRLELRDKKRVATCLGFGPRFLHSTGQAYKGGPNTGVFLQLTCDDARDVPVPGRKLGFGAVKAAQARGDLEVLARRGRRVLRVHLGADVGGGLRRLSAAVSKALKG
jgi:transaldolase/glucose-6-phosphate isomerase